MDSWFDDGKFYGCLHGKTTYEIGWVLTNYSYYDIIFPHGGEIMKIIDVVCSGGRTGFYFDDQRAIKQGAGHDGAFYIGTPVTDGFSGVRQAGESISVMIILEDGQMAYGDCAAVQYSGAGGRDPLFLADEFIPVIEKHIKPQLVGKEADSFRELTKMMEAITVDGKRLHTAIRYGVSQAILDAVAKANSVVLSNKK